MNFLQHQLSTSCLTLTLLQITEKYPTKIKNFGVWVRYQSRTGYHNMYKECRDVTLNGAVEQVLSSAQSCQSKHCSNLHFKPVLQFSTTAAASSLVLACCAQVLPSQWCSVQAVSHARQNPGVVYGRLVVVYVWACLALLRGCSSNVMSCGCSCMMRWVQDTECDPLY